MCHHTLAFYVRLDEAVLLEVHLSIHNAAVLPLQIKLRALGILLAACLPAADSVSNNDVTSGTSKISRLSGSTAVLLERAVSALVCLACSSCFALPCFVAGPSDLFRQPLLQYASSGTPVTCLCLASVAVQALTKQAVHHACPGCKLAKL